MFQRLAFSVGKVLRDAGASLERKAALMDNSRHRSIMSIYNKRPTIGLDTFVAPSASVIGEVQLAEKVSVWYSCILRGDQALVSIGSYTNVQDRTVIASCSGSVHVGNNVTIGHGCTLIGCHIGDNCLIGMGAILMNGVVMEPHSQVAAGTVLQAGVRVKSGEMWAGNPGKLLRQMSDKEVDHIANSAKQYYLLSKEHRDEFAPISSVWRQVAELQKH